MASKTIRHSILAFGVLTVSGFALQAYAAGNVPPEVSFYPAKAWKTNAPGAPACSIENEFNNGFVIGFKGKDKNLSTMDVDFRQDAFESGKNYNVSFTIPGSGTQQLSATATGASTISINVSGNKGLMGALRQASAVDLGVEGNDFRFYMTGYTGAAKSFEQCLGFSSAAAAEPALKVEPMKQAANASVPIVAPSGDKAPPPPPVDLSSVSSEEIPAPDKKPSKLAEIFPPDQKPVVQPLSYSSQKIKLGNQEITPEEAKALDTSPVARKRMSEILAEKIQKNPQIAEIDNVPPGFNKIENSTKPVNLDLKPGEKELRSPQPIIHREVVKSGKIDLTPYGKIEPASSEPPAADAPILSASMSDSGLITTSGAHKADPELLQKVSSLEAQVHDLQEENASLNADVTTNGQETQQENVAINSENWNLERATMRFNESERELKRMGLQMQQERAQCSVEKQDLESQLFDPQVTSREQLAKLADLEQKLDDTQRKAENQRIYYEERIRILEGGKPDKTAAK